MIYFDNSATTECKYFAKDYYVFGNPNSVHGVGRKAHEALEEARARVKKNLGVKSGKVIFGGTASQLIEAVFTRNHSLTIGSCFEHESLHKFIHREVDTLEKMEVMFKTFRKYYSPMYGVWMLTQNLTGMIYDAKSIGELCHKYGAYYIMDCTASAGHNTFPDGIEDYCDCLVTSSHKYHGPTGQGFMWVSDRFAELLGLTDDSHEEYGLIPGTPDVSGAVATSYAFENAIKNLDMNHYTKLAAYMNNCLDDANIYYKYIGSGEDFTSAINAIYFPEFNADALVQYLSSKDIYISAGHSACSSDAPDSSRVLEAFGLAKEEASHVVRISFCEDNTFEEIDKFVEEIVSFKNMFC